MEAGLQFTMKNLTVMTTTLFMPPWSVNDS